MNVDGTYQEHYEVFALNDHYYFYLDEGRYYSGGVPYNYVTINVNRFASNYVVVYRMYDGSTSTRVTDDPDSVFMNSDSLLIMTISVEDDGFIAGGKGIANIRPSEFISQQYSGSYPDGCGTTSYSVDQHYNVVFGGGSGTTDPTYLPSQKQSLELPALTVRQSSALPTEIRLDRNYPNPFNPSTTIQYQLPENHHVNITVYNTLGQQVQTLVDAEIAAGYHSVVWNVGTTPSGVYFVRMNAGLYRFTQRAILVK